MKETKEQKDPAFLFYSSDFLTGVRLMNYEEIGMYITLLSLQHQMYKLSEEDMLSICGKERPRVYGKFVLDEEGFYYNVRLRKEAEKRHNYVESRRLCRLKSDEDKVRIYMILDEETGFIKIGSSVNPKRRFKEISNPKNSAITVGENKKYKLIFISRIVERKIESTLHKKYLNKKVKGEWFSLEKEDIEYIEKTYEERTENENEIENENINKNINEIINKFIKDNNFSNELEESIVSWIDYKKQRREKYQDRGFRALLTQIKNKVNEYGENKMIEIITASMASNYKGIVFDSLKKVSKISERYKSNFEKSQEALRKAREEFDNEQKTG